MTRIARGLLLFSFLVVTVSTLAQGIQTPIVNLPLAGKWQACPDAQQEINLPNSFMFCDEQSGALLQVRGEFQLRSVADISAYFTKAGQAPASIDVSRFLVTSVFPIPRGYLTAVAPALHGGGKAPRLWDVKTGGNAVWFYVAQLFGGYKVSGSNTSSSAVEEYYPVRVTRAESRTSGTGDALLFEAETDKAAIDASVKRFKLPASISSQRLRYGWIQYAPGGISSGNGVVSVIFAAPVNSGLDVTSVLDQIIANFGKSAAGLQ